MVDHIQTKNKKTASPNSIKNKKASINPINNDVKCFQDAATVQLNHEEIAKNRKDYQKFSLLPINITGKK